MNKSVMTRLLVQPKIRSICRALWCLAWVGVASALLTPLPIAVPVPDWLAHFLLLCGMAIGAVTFSHRFGQLAALALLTSVIGVALEFAQVFVPDRTFEPFDAAANLLGALIGFAVAAITLHFVIRPADPALTRVVQV